MRKARHGLWRNLWHGDNQGGRGDGVRTWLARSRCACDSPDMRRDQGPQTAVRAAAAITAALALSPGADREGCWRVPPPEDGPPGWAAPVASALARSFADVLRYICLPLPEAVAASRLPAAPAFGRISSVCSACKHHVKHQQLLTKVLLYAFCQAPPTGRFGNECMKKHGAAYERGCGGGAPAVVNSAMVPVVRAVRL